MRSNRKPGAGWGAARQYRPVLLVGVLLLAMAVQQWWAAHFGHLDCAHTMRWVVSGVTLTALGFQTILSSFFVSILGVKKAR